MLTTLLIVAVLSVVLVAMWVWLRVSRQSRLDRRIVRRLAECVCPTCGKRYGPLVVGRATRYFNGGDGPDLRTIVCRRCRTATTWSDDAEVTQPPPPTVTRSPFPSIAGSQVALAHVDAYTGHLLNLDFTRYIFGIGEMYRIFANLEEARQYARQTVAVNPNVSCAIWDSAEAWIEEIGGSTGSGTNLDQPQDFRNP